MLKKAILWILVIIGVFLLWSLFRTTEPTAAPITFSSFLDHVGAGTVDRVVIRGDDLWGVTRPEAPGGVREFRTVVPENYPPMYDLLRSKGVDIELEAPGHSPLVAAVITWTPVLFIIGVWVYFMRTFVKRKQEQVPPPASGTPNS